MIECIPKLIFKDCRFIGTYKTNAPIYIDPDTMENWTFDETGVYFCTKKNKLYAYLEEDKTILLINAWNLSAIIFENYEEFIFHNPIILNDITPKDISSNDKYLICKIYKDYKDFRNEVEE